MTSPELDLPDGEPPELDRSATDDLALLLREAQQLLSDLDIWLTVFVLDGRSYVLEAAEPVYERAA